MRELLNVLYATTQGAMLHLDHDALRVEVEHKTVFRAPLIRLSAIVLVGRVGISPFVIERCAEDGRSVVWLDRNGRFKARMEGEAHGNVLLRRAQHLALSDKERTCTIARQIVASKIQNSRQVLLRAARETAAVADRAPLSSTAERLGGILGRLRDAADLDTVRGEEGEAAHIYFSAFPHMVRQAPETFAPKGRTRRPPRDATNALLSFFYSLALAECSAALEGVGLDPYVGYLHALRPGRPSLALDLLEEFRPVLADRLALTLINRRQLKAEDFEETPGGGVLLNDSGRKTAIVAYQRRKEEEITHRLLQQKVPLGLIPHVQARLLARHLRGELKEYPPFVYR